MAPGLAEAHSALADHYCAQLLDAERDRRTTDAARYEVLLRAHDRGQHAAILGGRGALTLVTDPPGAQVALHRYERHERRMVARPLGDIGPTPIVEHMLKRGSYLLVVTAPGHAAMRYPVVIERGGHWHGCAPGDSDPWPVPLPLAGALSDDEIYVPPAWTWTGGDPDAPDSLPRTRVWIDGLIIGRFAVTNREYIGFLDDLIAQGREDEAVAACPHRNLGTGTAGTHGDDSLSYRRDEHGRFVLRDDDPAEVWRPRTPVVLVNWHGAMAYTRWLSSTTGIEYRLPDELEREKASRGVDGRFFPWGNHFDATWACTLASHIGTTGRVDVDDYPMDESPYGMRSGAGNSRDWCINIWTHEGPAIVDGCLVIEPAPADSDEYRAIRGGAWSSVANHSRVTARFANRPGDRRSATGVRVARPFAARSPDREVGEPAS